MDRIKEKLILITGATDGIGKQTALDLARMGAHVIVHGRNEVKAIEQKNEIGKFTGNPGISHCYGDFGSLDEVRKMADNLREKYEKIDVLINNAGVFMKNRQQSADGYEMTFAVNHLAHFLLTGLLLELILKSDYGRIINVASQAHASHLDFDNLQAVKHFDGYDAYARSKLCNILFTNKLARELLKTHITVNSLHPGVIRTKLLRTGFGYGGSEWEEGSKTSVYLASSPDVENTTGKYFSHQKPASPAGINSDIFIQEKLWKLSEKLTDFTYDF